jgi:hypothetical protein
MSRVHRCARDEHFEDEQPPAVDERGNTRRVRAARPPRTFRRGCGQPDRQQSHTHGHGIEKIVTACREHRKGVGRHAHRHKGCHERQVECQDYEQALRSGHVWRSYEPTALKTATSGNRAFLWMLPVNAAARSNQPGIMRASVH